MLTRAHFDVLSFSFLFCLSFCVLCMLADKLLSFWVFLELCGLSVMPSFFYGGSGAGVYGVYSSLLTYVVMSGVSSVLVASGMLLPGLYYFMLLGFMAKFGLFPFIMWVYRVFSGSNWVLMFFLSIIMKFPVLFFCFLFQGNECSGVMYVDCFFTMAICGFLMWVCSKSWEWVWCHMSLVSISTLMVAGFSSTLGLCGWMYFYYLLWGSLVLYYLCNVGYYKCGGSIDFFWVYCFLLLVTPVSMPLFYKLSVCMAMFYSSVYMLIVWSLYKFSEQVFLFKLAGNCFYAKAYNVWCS